MHPHDNTHSTELRICEWCEKEFTYNPKQRGKGKFCSRDCGRKGQSQRISVTCDYCQQPFEIKRYKLAKSPNKYCSQPCFHASAHTPQPIEERFWEKVQKTDTCWLWTGYCDPNGYGRIGVGTREGGTSLAHRVSYELHYAPITDELFVCHTCDNPQCVRPDHLFLGTDADNVHDMIQKDRNLYGERCPWAKLTENQVLEIRHRYATGAISQEKLAQEYGINRGTLGQIVRRERWSHIP